jgi:hypothetical protein
MRSGSMLSMDRILTVDDYLYLPSHLTINRKEEMIRKFGDKVK